MTPKPLGIAALICLSPPLCAEASSFDPTPIETITSLKGGWNDAGTVFKITRARTDVAVQVDGWTMPPFMGLTSWAAFSSMGDGQLEVMGDLVLFEDEVNPVMSALLDAGMSVTALHNHFFFDEPKVFFMHVGGRGSAADLARGVRAAFSVQESVRAAHRQPQRTSGPAFAPVENAISAVPLETVLRTKGQASQGMFKAVFGREVHMGGHATMGKDMGVNTWAAFAGTNDNAVVDGDFAVRENELQTVLKTLRHAGINIVAIHHHMVEEEPRTLFLHYWGRGAAADLAAAVRAALDTQPAD